MASTSKIEWCDSTFNPWQGCTKISPACDNCYASVSTPVRRFGVEWGAGMPRKRTSPANWKQPIRWNAQPFVECQECGWRGESREMHWRDTCPSAGCWGKPTPARRRVFCASLADVFDNEVDPQWRADLFDVILATPNLDWLLLTKRIGNVQRMVTAATLMDLLPSNVWIGATICNQEEADRDIPKLLALRASVRFLSMEPLLGPVDLTKVCLPWGEGGASAAMLARIGWVIVGGESGQLARPMRAEWVRSLRDQCAAEGVPYLFKQWGEWVPAHAGMWFYPVDGMPTFQSRAAGKDTFDFNDGTGAGAVRVGKKAAGRMLDGVEHTAFPVRA
jgi:protein gp37